MGNRASKAASVLALGFSLFLAFAAGWILSRAPVKETGPADFAAPQAKSPLPVSDGEAVHDPSVERLRRENEDLRNRVAVLEGALKEARNEQFAARLTEALNEMVQQPGEEAVADRWGIGSTTYFKNSEAGMFGGIEDLAELVLDFALCGEAGVDFLVDTMSDEDRPEKERDLALGILAWIPHKKALDALLQDEYLAQEVELGNWDYVDSLFRQVTRLPAADVAPHLPTLDRLLLPELSEGGSLNDKETRVAAALAFQYGSREAWRLVCQRQKWEDPAELLSQADAIHTQQARQFVERVAAQHPSAESRAQANEMLNKWDADESE
jgi:hypothetical protein